MAEGLPPVIAEFIARTSEFKAGVGEVNEEIEKNAAISEAAMKRVEAAVEKQLAVEAEAAKAAGVEFDETGRKAELMAEKTNAASEESAESTSKFAAVSKLAFLGVAGAAAAFAVEGVKSAGEYNDSLATIQGNAQLTAKQTKAVGDAFLSTAGTTTVSAQQMATAFGPVAGVVQQLNGGVLTASASLQVMRAATTASEASGTNLASSTKDLTGIMQAFHIGTAGAADATNSLFNTSRTTGLSLDTLSSTVEKLHAKLGPVAPDLNTTDSLLVDLAEHGVTGSRGVMALNTGMTTLLGGSKATSAELKTLGVSVYNSKGQFVGMQSTIAQLQPKLAGMSQEQRNLAEKTLFGAGAANSMNLVIAGGVKGFTAATAAVNKHGAAEAAAEAKAHTLGGETETLKATVEDISVKFGEVLIPVLDKLGAKILEGIGWVQKHRAVFEQIGHVVETIVVKAFDDLIKILGKVASWIESHQTLVKAIAVGVGAIATAWAAWTVVITAWTAVTKAAAIAQALFDAVMDANPIVLVLGAILGLGAAFIYAYKHSAEFRDIIKDIGKVFEDVWSDVLKPAVEWLEGVPGDLVGAWNDVESFFSGMWDDIENFFSTAINDIVGIVKGWYPVILGIMTGGVLLLPALIFKYWSQIKTFIEKAWNDAIGFLESVPGKILAVFDGAVSWLEKLGGDIITGLWDGIKAEWQAGADFLIDLDATIKGYLSDAVDWLVTAGGNVIRGLWNGIKALWNDELSFFKDIGSTVAGFFSDAASWLVDAGEDIIKGLINGIKNMAGKVGGAIKSTLGSIPGVGSVLNHIPGLATGGYVTKPTVALLGEGGEGESVIPDSMWAKLNNNGVQSLTSKVGPATTPTESSSGGQTFVFNVNGAVLGTMQQLSQLMIAAMAQHGSINSQTYQPFSR